MKKIQRVHVKKGLYHSLFVIVGILLQFLLHAGLETWYTGLLLKDFAKYSFGLSWHAWFFIHEVLATIFFVHGVALGFWQGRYWWPRLYDEKGKVRYPKPWRI